MKLPMSSLIR